MFLKIKNLEKHYQKEKPLIKSLDFNVIKGDIVSFIGESGSGKTTFLRCLAGLEDINDGSIELNKVVLNSPKIFIESHNRKIGFVFQDYPLFPHLNVIDNITFNLDYNLKNKVSGILELTGLTDLTKRFPHELSGGEKQRVAIARAIVNQPDIIIADEPTGNLDPIATYEVVQILKKINDLGTTVIMTTHNKGVIDELGRRVITMDEGKIVRDDTEGKYVL